MAKVGKFVCGRCPWACKVIAERIPEAPPHTCLGLRSPYWTRVSVRRSDRPLPRRRNLRSE